MNTKLIWFLDSGENIPWTSYVPTWGGFSANPTVSVAKYALSDKFCVVVIECSADGTSNATTLTFTLPFAAASTAYTALSQITNLGSLSTTWGLVATRAGSTTADAYRNPQGQSWSNSLGKRINHLTLIYEIQ